MKLKRILAIQEEFPSREKQHILNNGTDAFEWMEFSTKENLHSYLKTEQNLEDALLIAATDETIATGKEAGAAVLAYVNPEIPNQSYGGVEMVVEGFEEADTDFLEKVYQRHHHIPWTILETERCIVRELCLDDMDALFDLYADEEIGRYTEKLYPYDEEKEYQRAYINNMYRFFGYGMWLVISKETGKVIGRAGLEHREYYGETELELGYLIGTKYQKQGYAAEVCWGILQYAKEHTHFLRINTLIEEENLASIHLTQKLGFSYVEDFELNGKRMHRFLLNFVYL